MMKNKSENSGFSLIEMLIAVFVFSLVMTTVIAVFISMTNSRKKIKAVQQDIEDARYAMDLMAKSLRTSSIMDGATTSDIKIFDYSQSKCVEYKFSGNRLQVGTAAGVMDAAACATTTIPAGAFGNMTGGNINSVYFDVSQTTDAPKKIGKATIAFKLCYNNICAGSSSDTAIIQTTVSLRDYQEVNP